MVAIKGTYLIIALVILVITGALFQVRRGVHEDFSPEDTEKIDAVCSDLYDTEQLPENYSKVYRMNNVLTRAECKWIIQESEKVADERGGWDTKRHIAHPTVDLSIYDVPEIHYFIENITYRKIIPAVEKLYNVPENVLGLNDPFVVKYDIGGQSYLQPHRDYSEFSFVIVLNKEFRGGGTYFTKIDEHVDADIGDVVIFSGQNEHSGLEITDGTRYIIAGFLQIGNDDAKTRCKNRH